MNLKEINKELLEEVTSLRNQNLNLSKKNKELKKQLSIHVVSQRSELLVAYEKQHYTPSEWALASKQCEKEIDDFLATNCA